MRKRQLPIYVNSFITGKCEEVLAQFPSNCIDFILTSPPYADQRFYGTEESRVLPSAYVKWFMPKAEEIYRVLSKEGSFVLNINDKVVNGFQQLYVYELVLRLCNDIGFKLVRDYIWHNTATPPNIYSTGKYGRTKKSHEYCFWFAKGDSWTFNMDPIRKPYSKDMQKFLEGKGKGGRDKNARPSTHSFDCSKIWTNNGGSDPGSVIEIGNSNSNDAFFRLCKQKGISHPARFPEKLAEFFILAGTKKGDLVLDPFSGSGTTALVAAKHHRKWIGIDTNKDYVDLSKARLKLEIGE